MGRGEHRLILGGFLAPTAFGTAFVIGQALLVALLGDVQYVALKAVAKRATLRRALPAQRGAVRRRLSVQGRQASMEGRLRAAAS